jgi:hypothetical protein
MKSYRYGCFGPWRPHRYGYGFAFAAPDSGSRTTEVEAAEPSWYEQRVHRHRGRRSGSFGVRRPLRFLSYQLDLDESQRRRIAVVLDGLKTEREQAALDEKKMVTELADRLTDPAVTTDALTGTLNARVRSTERVQQQIAGGDIRPRTGSGGGRLIRGSTD